ncbi:Metallo-hydrolase/oxidoreductase [Rhodotorula sp. JG-1b]|nr:Metallo-hydrolase/oxidoreductase [Rhodotorula sp. JG-1b]
MPVDTMSLTFLGTAAGRPCATRNVSSLVVKLDSRLWMVDAGEGTQHRLLDPRCKKLAMSKVARIFVTHMHADHVNGLPGLLATISAADSTATTADPPLEIYGPSGLRQFLRCTLSLTQTILARPYRVHELLFSDEQGNRSSDLHPSERLGQDLRADEKDGFWRNFVSEDGVTVSAGPILHTIRCLGYLFDESPRTLPIEPARYIPHLKNPINRAGLLQSHGLTNPLSLLSRFQANPDEEVRLADGTVLRAPGLDVENGGRRIVILGDTYDASALVPLIRGADVGACDEAARRVDLVVHESTNAYLPTLDESQSPLKKAIRRAELDQNTEDETDSLPLHSLESVTALAQSHGHSTPQVAGRFARSIQAQRLVLNHLSVKYPDPEAREANGGGDSDASREKWARMLREIERQAEQAFRGVEEEGMAGVMAARDFLEIEIPRRDKLARGGKSK